MTSIEFEKKLESQVNLDKMGIYEVFAENNELAEYWGLKKKEMSIMQKVFVAVFEGEIVAISFERRRAAMELLDAAGVSNFEELEELYK